MRKLLCWLFVAATPLHADDSFGVLPDPGAPTSPAATPLQTDDDLFRERFADPATRDAALAELVPGTREAFFHAALAHQLAGREAEFSQTLAAWKAASTRQRDPVSATGMTVLENRQLLLDYQRDPQASLAELIRRLKLTFDDAQPDAAAAASLPTRLDPALVTEAGFEKAAATAEPKAPYTQFKAHRIWRELQQVNQFDSAKTRWFVEHLDRADLPGVVPLIARSLDLVPPVAFGSTKLHDKLTADQLAALLKAQPDLITSETFARAYLGKLRPGSETDFKRDPQAHAAHLQRCREFAMTLPPALNSLKAHVLYHHLRLQAELGEHPKADFIAYLALPRDRHELLKIPRTTPPFTIQLNAKFETATACPPIGNDLPLIESYLAHFLGQTDSAADFAPYLPEAALTRLHARARLLAGATPDRWGGLLDPAEFKALQQESRIAFAPGAPGLLNADAAVALTLDLKNTPDLLLRCYELDLPAQLAQTNAEPQVTIDLDGLVPHAERRLKFTQAPLIQHRETIALPELAGPGAWLVEFVGGPVSARALIRKGQLIPYVERTATGQTIRVFDETGAPVPTAVLTLGTAKLAADAGGLIVVPNAPNQPPTSGILTAGKLAKLVSLSTREDKLALDTSFHLDREQLLADLETQLQLRVRLTNHGHEIPLDRLTEPSLVLKAELLGGITTERVIAENLTLKSALEIPFTVPLEIPFQVPADLLCLTLTLRGTVTPATGGEPVKLTSSATYQINSDLTEARIGTAFFSPTATGHRLELRGRNGEPLPSRALTLSCSRYDYEPSLELEVRTDAKGQVDLGRLDTIDYLTVTGDAIEEAIYGPPTHSPGYTTRLQLPPQREIRLPLTKPADAPDRLALSLLETRDGAPIRDHFAKLAIDQGQLVIRDLPPGDYQLTQGDSTTTVLISAGRERDGLLVSPSRILPRHAPNNPTIASATTTADEVVIQLRDASPATLVSLVGKRYHHEEWNPGSGLSRFTPPLAGTLRPGFLTCGFLTERRLGDEMRYILDRRAAPTFPGSLLPRPGLLLNRWSDEDLDQETLIADPRSDGDADDGRGFGGAFGSVAASKKRGDDRASSLAAVCDFLKTPAVVHFNLTPAADGSLRLPLTSFKDCQFIQIVATDDFAEDERILPLPASDPPLRDRRIARPLDPAVHHHATRNAAALAKGATATIENLLDADWRAFTTLAEAYQFLFGMQPDQRLRDFAFLIDWPELTEERKLELLATRACHEFHLFLARKDRPFFAKHVKPLLAQKPEPTFIDELLLERDLTPYLRPYAWQRLNAAEKALLGQALPAARSRIARELTLRWDLEAPSPDAATTLFTQTLRGTDLATQDSLGLARNDRESLDGAMVSSGVAYLQEKLRRIIIPKIDFEDITVEEAVDFLRSRAAELDMIETDPGRKGINFLIRQTEGEAGPGSYRIKSLRLTNVPIGEALKYICEAAKLRYKSDDYAVTLGAITEMGSEMFTRSFRVPPGFHDTLNASMSDGGPGADPFAADDGRNRGSGARKPLIQLLKKAGIAFGEGCSATLTPSGLLVTNTAGEMDKIEALISAFSSDSMGAEAPELPNSVGSPSSPTLIQAAGFEDPEAPEKSDSDPFAADPFSAAPDSFGTGRPLRPLRPSAPHLFPDRTRQWREANYYQNTKPTDETLIPLNRFWLDLAAWDGQGRFLSPHFNACHTSANAALLCLALLDLPFKAERPEVTVDGTTLRVKAREPMLLFYKDTRRTDQVAAESPLLVRETFSPYDEPFRTVAGREVENPVTGDFRPGVPYRASLIVTNPTGIGRRIDVLAQIPAGAIPLGGEPATLSATRELEPHGVLKLELAFYFPAAGDFAVYPLHVSEDGTILAHTAPRTLRVSTKDEPLDAASWLVLAANGTTAQVLERLRTENLRTLDLSAIRWRLQDREVFLSIAQILRERLFFSPAVAAYGFHHNDPAALQEYFENSAAVRQLGQWLDSPLLTIRPRVHHDWETLDFDPLVNSRAHRFTDQSRLTHEAARAHYQALLDQLAWKPALDAADQLTLTAYLFLQDRIAEGLARFDLIDPAKLPGRLNYDYLHTVVSFYREQPAAAQALAAKTLPTLPPGLWRDRFQAVSDQAAEIAALAKPVQAAQPAAQAAVPQLDLALGEAGKLVISHRALATVTLRLFSVDLEVLFSKDPFLKGAGKPGGQPAIRPNETVAVELAPAAATTAVDLPPNLRQGNLLVVAESGPTQLLKVLDSAAMDVRQLPQDRQVQVFAAATGKPLPKTYIKVYAETRSGEVVFHKDGYTDLRGKFDYLSHTGTDVSNLKRLALLVSHPDHGARTVIYPR
jgi:hypothetical protein